MNLHLCFASYANLCIFIGIFYRKQVYGLMKKGSSGWVSSWLFEQRGLQNYYIWSCGLLMTDFNVEMKTGR